MKLEILKDAGIVFVIAFALAVLVPQPAAYLSGAIVAILAISVFFSMLDTGFFVPSGKDLKDAVGRFLAGYGALSAVLILTAQLLPNPEFAKGLILYAAFPPAVMVVGLSHVWGGNVKKTMVGQLVSYFAGLAFVPVISLVFIGRSVSVWSLVEIVAVIFLLPLAALMAFRKLSAWKCGFSKEAVNVLNGLVFYTIVAGSIGALAGHAEELLLSAIFVTLVSFVLTYAIHRFSGKNVDIVLFGTFKNGGASAAAAMLILGPAATLFLSTRILIDLVLVMFMGQLFHRKG